MRLSEPQSLLLIFLPLSPLFAPALARRLLRPREPEADPEREGLGDRCSGYPLRPLGLAFSPPIFGM